MQVYGLTERPHRRGTIVDLGVAVRIYGETDSSPVWVQRASFLFFGRAASRAASSDTKEGALLPRVSEPWWTALRERVVQHEAETTAAWTTTLGASRFIARCCSWV